MAACGARRSDHVKNTRQRCDAWGGEVRVSAVAVADRAGLGHRARSAALVPKAGLGLSHDKGIACALGGAWQGSRGQTGERDDFCGQRGLLGGGQVGDDCGGAGGTA